jgi:hypothetical protein
MGWASAGDIFNPVARALIEAGASDELKRKTLGTLIGKLREGDWDTEDQSLGLFAEDPAIVAAFREHGIVQTCGNEDGPDEAEWCELELDHDGDHDDQLGHTWPRVTQGKA